MTTLTLADLWLAWRPFGDFVLMQRGHNRRGCGWFVWETEYPEEGSSFFESKDEAVAYAEELRESLEADH